MKQINLNSQLLTLQKIWTTLILEENADDVDFLENIKPASNIHLQVKK